MADFARALELGSKKRGNNNNNEKNIGNTTNIRRVNLSMTKANLIRSQRITEEYQKIDRELQKIIRRLKDCNTIVTRRPKEVKYNQNLINDLIDQLKKKGLSKNNQIYLNELMAENIKLKNDIQGCRIETEGLLDKKKQLETELFFLEKSYREEQSLGPFNVPNRKAATLRTWQPYSMVGGRAKTRGPRRQTRRK